MPAKSNVSLLGRRKPTSLYIIPIILPLYCKARKSMPVRSYKCNPACGAKAFDLMLSISRLIQRALLTEEQRRGLFERQRVHFLLN